MTIMHIVLFKLKEGVSEEAIAAMNDAVNSMGKLDCVETISCGKNFTDRGRGTWDASGGSRCGPRNGREDAARNPRSIPPLSLLPHSTALLSAAVVYGGLFTFGLASSHGAVASGSSPHVPHRNHTHTRIRWFSHCTSRTSQPTEQKGTTTRWWRLARTRRRCRRTRCTRTTRRSRKSSCL